MPLKQVSVPYRVNVWIRWPEWYFAHHTVSKCCAVSCLMHAETFQMLVSSCPDNHYYTCFFEKEKKISLFIHNLQVDTFVLVTKSHSSWQAFLNQTPNVMSLCWRVSRHMSTWPSGSNRGLTPRTLQWLWLPYLPTEDEGGRIKYPVINCRWYCARKTAVVKIWMHVDNYLNNNVKATLGCWGH